MKTMLTALKNQAGIRPDAPAFVDPDETLTFADVERISDAAGSALIGRGAKREAVLVFTARSAREIALFFAVWKAGCFYVPVDAEMGENRIRSILDRVRPRFAIADETGRKLLNDYGFAGEALDPDLLIAHAPDADALRAVEAATLDVDPAYLVLAGAYALVYVRVGLDEPRVRAAIDRWCDRQIPAFVKKLDEEGTY